MKAEIIAVGTELLLGQIVNTNARYLSQGLAGLGIDVYFQTVVGDNAGRLREAIRIARSRADLLLFTGGLGPTMDDLTKDVLAEELGRQLELHEPTMAKIEEIFRERGAHMVESNRRQASWIAGSVPLANETGLAVGNALQQDGTRYILLPGPPMEMKPMFEGPATAWLLQESGRGDRLYSRILRFAGIGESLLENKLIDLIQEQSDPTIAPYAKEGEVAIRLSSKSEQRSCRYGAHRGDGIAYSQPCRGVYVCGRRYPSGGSGSAAAEGSPDEAELRGELHRRVARPTGYFDSWKQRRVYGRHRYLYQWDEAQAAGYSAGTAGGRGSARGGQRVDSGSDGPENRGDDRQRLGGIHYRCCRSVHIRGQAGRSGSHRYRPQGRGCLRVYAACRKQPRDGSDTGGQACSLSAMAAYSGGW